MLADQSVKGVKTPAAGPIRTARFEPWPSCRLAGQKVVDGGCKLRTGGCGGVDALWFHTLDALERSADIRCKHRFAHRNVLLLLTHACLGVMP